MKDKALIEFIIGGWHLVAWTIVYPDGKTTWPFGQRAKGQIVYTRDGQMSATIMAADRSTFTSSNVRTASQQEQAEAYVSYFHYAGSWTVQGDQVRHQVELALNPNLIGSVQTRSASSNNINQLVLSASENISSDESRTHHIEWSRAKPIS